MKRCKLKFECSQNWFDLKLTNDPNTRFCNHCSKDVIYCETKKQFKECSSRGDCVCFKDLDTGQERLLGLPLPPEPRDEYEKLPELPPLNLIQVRKILTKLNRSKESIREDVILIRRALESIKDPNFAFECKPIKNFEDKLNYPLDVQIFMEEIGYIYIAISNVFIFECFQPTNIENIDTVSDMFDACIGEDFFSDSELQKMRFTCIDDELNLSYFDIASKPYKFINEFEPGISFLDYVFSRIDFESLLIRYYHE